MTARNRDCRGEMWYVRSWDGTYNAGPLSRKQVMANFFPSRLRDRMVTAFFWWILGFGVAYFVV